MTYNAPAGWYPSPAHHRLLRWWDGTSWTDHVAPSPASHAAVHLDDEESAARWARAALLAAVAAQVGAGVVFRSQARSLFDELTSDTGQLTPYVWGRWPALLMQVMSAVGVVASVIFLVWFSRSATNARALGLSARRSPAAGVAGFMVPIINLWWPYQSTPISSPRAIPPDPSSCKQLRLRRFGRAPADDARVEWLRLWSSASRGILSDRLRRQSILSCSPERPLIRGWLAL